MNNMLVMQVPKVDEWLQSEKKCYVLQWFIVYLMAIQNINLNIFFTVYNWVCLQLYCLCKFCFNLYGQYNRKCCVRMVAVPLNLIILRNDGYLLWRGLISWEKRHIINSFSKDEPICNAYTEEETLFHKIYHFWRMNHFPWFCVFSIF